MRGGSSHARGSFLAAVVVAVGVVAVAGAGVSDATPARSSCDRPAGSTLVETSKVRVYALPEGSVKPANSHAASIAGRPVFGCLVATGRSLPLNFPATRSAYWVGVDTDPIAVSSSLVAYAFTQYYLDTHETWIRVRNLRTGRILRSCPAGGGMAPHTFPHIIKLVISSSGAVAWSAEGKPSGPAPGAVLACHSAEPTVLDEGEGIDLDSLSLEDGVLSWADAGGRREAGLE
jgi:hypothetical protein